jgi:CRISPR-associated endonuclease Cas1
MNALWVNRLFRYKNSPQHIKTAKRIIELKITRQSALLEKYKNPFLNSTITADTIEKILLGEARAAKTFWHEFKALLPASSHFTTRTPRAGDIPNRLLDIGYHRLAQVVGEILQSHNIPSAIGLLHSARKTTSAPLVYDLMEMFRSDTVDAEVLKFFRLKKKELPALTPKEISHFLHRLHKRFGQHYYLKSFRQCHTYRYYMELQIMKFIKAVDHDEVFQPLYLPNRHESRCPRALTTNETAISIGSGKVLSNT